ncbi:MAG TPA: hypothetical protein VFK13_12225 [Gemmatimonadaceae bacterium]|nr:hypothetical protein [Gemmatimonadaceae bacterium]
MAAMRRHSWLLLCAAWLAAAACAEGGRQRSLVACNDPRDSVFHLAASDYLDSVNPKPRRFLEATNADSTLPAGARQAMQDIGPTYLYPPDSAQRALVLTRLKSYGSVPTLLLSYRGSQRPARDSLVVSFEGMWVGGADDGKKVPPSTARFHCNDGVWERDAAAAPAGT